MQSSQNRISIRDAANSLNISEALIQKFIRLGFVKAVSRKNSVQLTGYNFRRLIKALDLYEQNVPTETIENILNN